MEEEYHDMTTEEMIEFSKTSDQVFTNEIGEVIFRGMKFKNQDEFLRFAESSAKIIRFVNKLNPGNWFKKR